MAAVKVFTNIGQLMTLKGVVKKQGRHIKDKDLGVIKNGALVLQSGKVLWVGPMSRLPTSYQKAKRVDCGGAHVFPGFVDCHTHMIFAGHRGHEFEMRNQGWTYQQIAEQGGGILSTMRATRKASLEKLIQLGQQRVDCHLKQGVTTIEIKSGYGLTRSSEEKMLSAARQLKKAHIVSTYLGAHAIPSEFASEEDYLTHLENNLKRIHQKQLAQRVDIFIEKGYFSVKKSRAFLQKAKDMGFSVTIHADQLNRTGATRLAVQLGAQSADHVICLNKKDKELLAQSQTVGVLLPTADFYLKCAYPDARTLIDQGACVALATDFNPGSSPTQSISLVGLLARLEMKMTLAEVFAALTFAGAKALGLEQSKGALLPGYDGDFFLSDRPWQDFFYDMQPIQANKTFVAGQPAH